MQNPFTTTFSKIPVDSYIPTEQVSEIIENFNYDNPSESVYKITGVRGSGKTVLLAKVEEEFSSEEKKSAGWCVYRLSTSRDMLGQFVSMLIESGFGKEKRTGKSLNISANILGSGGSIGISSTHSNARSDVGVEIEKMLEKVKAKNKKILIGIDEVSRSNEMVIFASEFGKWLRAGYPVYLVCTGLYENIEQIYNVKNLTFFRRATTIKTGSLNYVKMTEMYKNKLSIDIDLAKQLSIITKGYPYAFQELGTLYFKHSKGNNLDEILSQLKSELFAYSYEKIWEEMTDEDKNLAKIITDKGEYKREEILAKMDKPKNYSVYRDRLLKRGIISARQAYISLALPYFAEYIKEYGL